LNKSYGQASPTRLQEQNPDGGRVEIKYSPQGGGVVLTLEYQMDTALLKVEDQGIGIPLEDQKHLFEPFHRGENVRTIPGTGLGLVVVKKCVDLHQGTIRFTSEPGVGTIGWVTLPL
jgi:signal transduction histidine kinase